MTIESEYLSEEGPGGLFTRLSRVALLLEEFQHRAIDRFGLQFVDYSVLRVLQIQGPPHHLSPSRLSEVLVRSTGGMTQILDRLESAGLVTRLPYPTDRRKVIVGLTAEGLSLVKKISRAWEQQKKDLLGDDMSAEELARLDGAVRTLLRLFAEDHERGSRRKRVKTVVED